MTSIFKVIKFKKWQTDKERRDAYKKYLIGKSFEKYGELPDMKY